MRDSTPIPPIPVRKRCVFNDLDDCSRCKCSILNEFFADIPFQRSYGVFRGTFAGCGHKTCCSAQAAGAAFEGVWSGRCLLKSALRLLCAGRRI